MWTESEETRYWSNWGMTAPRVSTRTPSTMGWIGYSKHWTTSLLIAYRGSENTVILTISTIQKWWTGLLLSQLLACWCRRSVTGSHQFSPSAFTGVHSAHAHYCVGMATAFQHCDNTFWPVSIAGGSSITTLFARYKLQLRPHFQQKPFTCMDLFGLRNSFRCGSDPTAEWTLLTLPNIETSKSSLLCSQTTTALGFHTHTLRSWEQGGMMLEVAYQGQRGFVVCGLNLLQFLMQKVNFSRWPFSMLFYCLEEKMTDAGYQNQQSSQVGDVDNWVFSRWGGGLCTVTRHQWRIECLSY